MEDLLTTRLSSILPLFQKVVIFGVVADAGPALLAAPELTTLGIVLGCPLLFSKSACCFGPSQTPHGSLKLPQRTPAQPGQSIAIGMTYFQCTPQIKYSRFGAFLVFGDFSSSGTLSTLGVYSTRGGLSRLGGLSTLDAFSALSVICKEANPSCGWKAGVAGFRDLPVAMLR
jgi:hypothetical protein